MNAATRDLLVTICSSHAPDIRWNPDWHDSSEPGKKATLGPISRSRQLTKRNFDLVAVHRLYPFSKGVYFRDVCHRITLKGRGSDFCEVGLSSASNSPTAVKPSRT